MADPYENKWRTGKYRDAEQAKEKEPAKEEQEKRTQAGDAEYKAELEQLQKVDFALVELTLYLDTHPADMQAVQQFNQLAQRRAQLAHAFELKYGPLMQFGHSFTRFPWQWPDTPWPWQV